MREVYYHDWLSNPVMVKKHDGSWRMCVDFTDLNKACPQDCYPLPEIDWKIESLCGYPFKCFLDSYKGYHQIQMAESDEEKMAFYTSQIVLLRRLLKNTGATNQRLVDRAFDSHVGRNMEVYVNDLVIKSHTEAEMVRDIGETFRTLRKINMKLNPKKCMFGAVEGMFLGYTITPEGIKPCPDKTEAVLQLPSLRMIKEFTASNNEAEYEALIAGLCIAAQMGVQNVQVNVDSKLVANQVLGTKNKKADVLSKIASTSFTHLSKQVLVEGGTLPSDRKEASKLHIKARQYELKEGTLYRRSFLKTWLRCLGPLQASYVIREIHEGSCSMHAGPRSVVAKAMQLGYYWPTMHRDSGEGIKARLGEGNKNWLEKLPRVLWAHRTMNNSSHGDTPFSLTYGTEAVIPAEIGMPTYRTMTVDTVHNDEELRLNLDLLEEKRERAAICEAKSKMKMAKYYNDRVRGVAFRPGDFVYRSNDASHAAAGGKL
ncbi:reverse transcriptase domain-containing protein [Tanacetum coccineum]